MASKRIDQAKPFATLGVAIVLWLLVPVAVKSFLRATFFEFQAPITLTASRVRDLQEFWQLRLHSKDELVEAGRDQGRLTAAYETTVRDNTRLLAENERLQQMLNMPPPAGFRSEPARVGVREFSGWWQCIEIQKGRNYGIPVNAPVVFSGGLVGVVREVHAYSSIVELVSSPTFRLAASFEGDDRIVSFQGGINPTFGPAKGALDGVPVDITVSAKEPRRLLTSGLGGIYPPGLNIGQVSRVEKSNDGVFCAGQVDLDSRLASLFEVTVLIPLPPE